MASMAVLSLKDCTNSSPDGTIILTRQVAGGEGAADSFGEPTPLSPETV
jgi:hypothetical protein